MTARVLTVLVAAASLLAGCLGGAGSRDRDVADETAIRARIAVMEAQLRSRPEAIVAEVGVGDDGLPFGPFVNSTLSFTTEGLDQDAFDALVRDRSAWLRHEPELPEVRSLRTVAFDDVTDAESSLADFLGQPSWSAVNSSALEAVYGPRFAGS